MKKLESSTGYIKSLIAVYDEYPIYDHAIYIPDGAEKDYTEATREEFEAYVKKQEEKTYISIDEMDREADEKAEELSKLRGGKDETTETTEPASEEKTETVKSEVRYL